ncbi:MAG: SDR family NAD(P)-dependent oxidoreductase [Robiginitomaculum sp.]|nr:SDR family NAD(P)-dependent oxidoreductase [Robiginitomaculum sp.]
MQRLKGKVCLITGAARGIGKAIARAFITEGVLEVYVTDIDENTGRQTAHGFRGRFSRKLDVASEVGWAAIARAVPELDVLVNNAGITGFENEPH